MPEQSLSNMNFLSKAHGGLLHSGTLDSTSALCPGAVLNRDITHKILNIRHYIDRGEDPVHSVGAGGKRQLSASASTAGQLTFLLFCAYP